MVRTKPTIVNKTMKKYGFLVLICPFFLFLNKMIAQTPREIIGYYPAWQWYDRGQLVNPKTIRYDRYTIINYAFFIPKPDGSLDGSDAWADEILLEGQINWQTTPKTHLPNTSLVDLAHAAHVKVLISIGGWTKSDLFPTIAADETKRQKFVSECRRLIEKYNIDGVDIDWEYPGYTEHSGTTNDKENFAKLITDVRQNLDELSAKTQKNYLLTAAFGAAASNMENIDWPIIIPKLNAINLMTYDFNGPWSEKAGHNAPLYTADGNGADAAVSRLLNTFNVPADKICMGIAFYGRALKTKEAPILRGPLSKKADTKVFNLDDGAPMYYNILSKKHLFTPHLDSVAQVPYWTGKKQLRTFLTFDNEQSVAQKAQYIVDKNLKGTIIWDLTGDYLETKKGSGVVAATPLADTIIKVFGQNKKAVIEAPPAEYVPPVNPDLLKIETVTMTTDTGIAQHTQQIPDINVNTNEQVIPALQNDTTQSGIFMDFQILSDETDKIAISFDLKQKREAIINVKSLDGQILRGKACGVLEQGSNSINLTELFAGLPSMEYWIELSLPAFEVVPEDKVIHKWMKK
jgi:GH18 family chitinase